MKTFKDLKIKTKLIIIFTFIKVIPVILISMIALFGVHELYTFLNTNSLAIKKTVQEAVTSTVAISLDKSGVALGNTSYSIPKMPSFQEEQNMATLVSTLEPNETLYQNFLTTQMRSIMDLNTLYAHKTIHQTKHDLDNVVQSKLGEIDAIMHHVESETRKYIQNLRYKLTYATLALILFMILIAMWLSNHLRKRLDALLKGSTEFAKNNLTYHINVESNDEIGTLAKAFNQMARSLKNYMDTVMTLNASLEKKVQDRTSELLILNHTIQEQLDFKEEQEERLEIYAKIFSNTIEAIAITNLEGIVLQINDAFSTMTYYKPHEVLGKDIRLLRSYEHPNSLYQEIWDTVLSHQAWQGEVWNQRKDGTLYPALLIIHPILNREGNISYIVFIQHDISLLKKRKKRV